MAIDVEGVVSTIGEYASDAFEGISGLFGDNDLNDVWDWVKKQEFKGDELGAILGVIGTGAGWFDTSQQTAGYQGKIPQLTAVRNRLQQNIVRGQTAEESPRRAGSEGDRFFTDTFYGLTPDDQLGYGTLDDAVANANEQETAMNAVIAESPQSPIQNPVAPEDGGGYPQTPQHIKLNSPAWKTAMEKEMYANAFANSGISIEELYANAGIPNPNATATLNPQNQAVFNEATTKNMYENAFANNPEQSKQAILEALNGNNMAQGGIVNAIPQAYLSGPTDGMADGLPAIIDGKHPANLSHGEMVIPADVVSHMGNGNSEAGAKQFYDMMDRVRQARTGNKQQGKEINPNKFMPR